MRRAPPGFQPYGAGMAPPGSVQAKGLAVTGRLVHMLNVTVDRNGQRRLPLGPKPASGSSLGVAVLVGQLSAADAGAHGSAVRAATENAVRQAVHGWSLANGAAPTGWFLVGEWQQRGGGSAVLDVRAEGAALPRAAEQAFMEWADRGELRLPHPSAPGGVLVVPCKLRASQRPLNQVMVSFRGLPDAYAMKAAPDAILRGVGYGGGLRVSEVFYGVDAWAPMMGDGSVCAYVTPPPGDLTLSLLPPVLQLAGSFDVLKVSVSSRAGNVVIMPGPASGRPPPPPPPPCPSSGGRAAPAEAEGAGAARGAPAGTWAAVASAAPTVAPAVQLRVRVPAGAAAVLSPPPLVDDQMSVDSQPEQPGGDEAMHVDGAGPAAAGVERRGQLPAMGGASPTRAAAVWRGLTEWASTEFPSAEAVPGEVERLLGVFAAAPESATLLAQWAAEPGDIHPELLPADVVGALVALFHARQGHRRQSAYADGGSTPSSAGGGPSSAAGVSNAANEQRRQPARAPAPRRSPRPSLGVAPKPGALMRGAPEPPASGASAAQTAAGRGGGRSASGRGGGGSGSRSRSRELGRR